MSEAKKSKEVNYKQEEALLEVSSTVLGKKSQRSKKVRIRPFVTNPAHVSVSLGTSFETQDGSWAKVNAMISMPCYKEEVEPVFSEVAELTDKLLTQEIDRITGGK